MLTTSGHTHPHPHTSANRIVSVVLPRGGTGLALPGVVVAGRWVSLLSYITRTTGPRGGGIAYSELAALHQLLVRKMPPNIHTNLPTGQSDGGKFSVDGPSSQITLAYPKLAETNLHMVLALLQVMVSLRH